MFDLDFPCCASCHDEYEWGFENNVWIPMCEHGGGGEDIKGSSEGGDEDGESEGEDDEEKE